MVPVRRATSWRTVTRLMSLRVSVASRVLFVAVSVATNTQSCFMMTCRNYVGIYVELR